MFRLVHYDVIQDGGGQTSLNMLWSNPRWWRDGYLWFYWGEAVRIGIPYESWLSIMSRSLIKRCCNDFGGLSALHHLGLEQSMFRLVRGRPSWIMTLYGLPDFRLHHPPGHVTCDVIGLDQSACRAGPPSWIRSKNMFRLVWVGHLGLRRCDDFGWW